MQFLIAKLVGDTEIYLDSLSEGLRTQMKSVDFLCNTWCFLVTVIVLGAWDKRVSNEQYLHSYTLKRVAVLSKHFLGRGISPPMCPFS